jgi:hypothetical protein
MTVLIALPATSKERGIVNSWPQLKRLQEAAPSEGKEA